MLPAILHDREYISNQLVDSRNYSYTSAYTGCLHLENVHPLLHTDQTKQDRDLKFGVDLKQVTTLGLIEAIFDN